MGMRRQVIVGGAAGLAAVLVIGVVVFASPQGWFGGRAHQMLIRGRHAAEQGRLPEAQVQLESFVATFPDSPWIDDALLALGEVYEARQDLAKARQAYQTILTKFPDSSLAAQTQERLGLVNIALLFSPLVTDLDSLHVVQSGESLGKIASASGTTVELLKKANGLKNDNIRPQQQLKVPTENNRFIKSYPVGTGRDNSTPEGTFKIVNKVPNPVWYKQGAVVPPDSKENILGTRWMGFDKTGYGTHGSVDPSPINEQLTAGCIRMTNSDVEELFAIVPIGTEVNVVN